MEKLLDRIPTRPLAQLDPTVDIKTRVHPHVFFHSDNSYTLHYLVGVLGGPEIAMHVANFVNLFPPEIPLGVDVNWMAGDEEGQDEED